MRRIHLLSLTLSLFVVSLVFASSAFAQAAAACATCAVPALSAPATPSPSTPRPEEAELKALDAELDQAFLRGDRAAVAAMLDDAMVSVGGFDDVTPREAILEQIQPRKSPSKAAVTASEVLVRTSGDAAIVTSKKKRVYELNGRLESYEYRDTNTYVRRGGRWKLVSSTSSSVDPPYTPKDVSFDLDFDAAASLGDPKAEVVMYEYSDYECPMCRHFAAETLPRVARDYVRTGRVALVFRDNPLDVHPRAAAAAAAGACAEAQGKRWPMSDKLLQDPVALSDEDFRRDAREVGLDAAAFDRCLADPATAERVRRGLDDAQKIGVKGTPIFLVGVRKPGDRKVRAIRKIEGALPYEVFQATLDGLLRARGL